MKNYLYLLFGMLLCLSCNGTKISGTISDTDTGKSALVYNPDFTPAIGATVKIFKSGDTTRQAEIETKTDQDGRYSFGGLVKGTYNIIAKKDTLIAFQDSVYISPDTNFVKSDTLGKPGSITAIAGLQPNHDPRTVTAQILGTDIYANVGADGKFTIRNIAEGKYSLRLVTTLPDYTPTFFPIEAFADEHDTLNDTLWMIYTGIPVVTGISATYDTLNGIVNLSWNKSNFRDLQRFLIFKDTFRSITLSDIPIGTSADTFYNDTIFKRSILFGSFSFSDYNDYQYEYRINIQNNSAKQGDTYKFVDIVTPSPSKVRTSFSFEFYHLVKMIVSDSASINDSVICRVQVTNLTRNLRSIVWSDILTGRAIKSTNLDTTKSSALDSISYSWTNVGSKGIECKVTDIAGAVWLDTAVISIVADKPVVKFSYSLATISLQDSIHLHFQTFDIYGKIVKIEWAIGNTKNFIERARVDSVIDTVIIAPSVPDSAYQCFVRVTDDDGNVVLDSIRVKIDMFKLATDSPEFGLPRTGHSSVVFQDRMWILAGSGLNNYCNDAWFSENGIAWIPATQKAPFQARAFHSSCVFNDRLWIIAGQRDTTLLSDIWSSPDGSNWTQSPENEAFLNRSGHASIVFNNAIWIIGGRIPSAPGGGSTSSKLSNDVWYSMDGTTWIQAIRDAPFAARTSHSSFVFNGKMWVIGGYTNQGFVNDVWSSSDGINWQQETSSAGFAPRMTHSSFVYDHKIWIVGGFGWGFAKFNDVWFSINGIDWILETDSPGFEPVEVLTSLAFRNEIWLIGGICPNGKPNGIWHSAYTAQ